MARGQNSCHDRQRLASGKRMTRGAKERSTDRDDLPKCRGQHVLVVDDEAALASLMQENLNELGYLAEAFSSSTAALQAFREEPGRFDAVVTDDRMPGLQGTALIREIRSIRTDMPALIVSGHVSADLLSRAREIGVAEVLKKPLALRELADALYLLFDPP